MKGGLGDDEELVAMKSRAILLLVLSSLLVAACARSGDDPAEQPSPTAPAEVTSDSLAYDPAGSDEELTVEEESPGETGTPASEQSVPTVAPSPPDDPGEAPDPATGDAKVNVQDGTPNQPMDPEIPLSDLPSPTIDPPKYPETDPVIPPPRD